MDGPRFLRCVLCVEARALWCAISAFSPTIALADLAPFVDETAARGLSYSVLTNTLGAGGAAFADLDNDGSVDLVTTNRASRRLGIFRNNGRGYFTDFSSATPSVGMIPPPGNLQSCGPVVFDYDNDGFLDILVTRWGVRNLLFRNKGDFTFEEVGVAAGLSTSASSMGSSAGDFDLDGWTDIYISNATGGNLLYRNLGNSTFEEVGVALGVDGGVKPTLQSVFFDYDFDGDVDLYVGNDRGEIDCNSVGNRLYMNVGGQFVDVTTETGTIACADSMSTTIGDFDGNGALDIFVTSTPPGHALLLNQGDGSFVEGAASWGVAAYSYGWGAALLDFDNDRHLDLYICHSTGPNHFYRHAGAPICSDLAPQLQIADPGASYVTSTADIDHDGDLDLLVLNRNGPTRLYVNHEGQERRWIKIQVVGLQDQHFAIGATIRLHALGQSQVQTITAGSNFMAQEDLVRHFGLGDATIVETLSVLWPGGETRAIHNLPADNTWRVYPSGKLGDANHDGVRDLLDFDHLRSCYTPSRSTVIVPGCEVMDYTGDGAIDADDAVMLLSQFPFPLLDCNHNEVPDLMEILDGTVADFNGDGVADGCEPYCAMDIHPVPGDNHVNLDDVRAVVAGFGQTTCPVCDVAPARPGEIIGDGQVSISDVISVVMAFGPCPDSPQ